MKKYLKNKMITVVEIISIAVFIFLMKNQIAEKWVAIFGITVLLSSIFGRFYCGWICHMNTLFRPINWLSKKLKIKRLAPPKFMKWKFTRYFMLLFFVGIMIVSKKVGLSVPILPIMIIASFIVSLIFEESLWHNHICPFGTMLNATSRKAVLSVKIDADTCISCGLCQRVCPAEAIITLDSKKREIITKDCLVCFECQKVCPVSAIEYRK